MPNGSCDVFEISIPESNPGELVTNGNRRLVWQRRTTKTLVADDVSTKRGIGTAEVENAFGAKPDFIIPTASKLTAAGGKVCFDTVDCFAWGNYTGGGGAGADAVGTPFAALGTKAARRKITGGSNATALDDGDDTGDSANDFEEATPAPKANATSVRRRTRRLDPNRLVDPMFLSLCGPKRRAGEAAKEEKQLQLGFPCSWGVPGCSPAALAVTL